MKAQLTEITLTFWKLLCITKSMNWNYTESQIHSKKKFTWLLPEARLSLFHYCLHLSRS